MYYSKEHNPITSTIIVEPVGGGCNLSCLYCYHNNIRENKVRVMSFQILEQLIIESLRINEHRVKFLWHGGEPMLAGIQFYRAAIDFQQRFRLSERQKISNHFQTNATLINDEWVDFFKTNSFRISTSIDGPAWLHDLCRGNEAGIGSFYQAVAGIKLLKKSGMTVGIVSTINCHNAKFPDEVYETLCGLDIKSFEFNIASDIAGAPSLAPTEQDAIDFLKRTFDIWFDADDPSIYVRIFDNTIRSLLDLPLKDCSFSYNRCREYVAIDEGGELYTCGRFLKEPDAYLGSFLEKPMINILTSQQTIALYDKVALIRQECRECSWLGACGGGCAYQRWLNGGFGFPFPQCNIRKALFEHVAMRVKPYL